jgi:hypothetical protein
MRGFVKRNIDIENISGILEKDELADEDLIELRKVSDTLNTIIREAEPREGEAAGTEPPEGTPQSAGTSPQEDQDKEEKEAAKQETLAGIDTLFEIEKETSGEETNG